MKKCLQHSTQNVGRDLTGHYYWYYGKKTFNKGSVFLRMNNTFNIYYYYNIIIAIIPAVFSEELSHR